MDTTPAEGAMGGVRVVDFATIMIRSSAAHVLAGTSAGVIRIKRTEVPG